MEPPIEDGVVVGATMLAPVAGSELYPQADHDTWGTGSYCGEGGGVCRETRELAAAQLAHATVGTTGLTPQDIADEVRGRLSVRVPSPTGHTSGVTSSAPLRTQDRTAARQVI